MADRLSEEMELVSVEGHVEPLLVLGWADRVADLERRLADADRDRDEVAAQAARDCGSFTAQVKELEAERDEALRSQSTISSDKFTECEIAHARSQEALTVTSDGYGWVNAEFAMSMLRQKLAHVERERDEARAERAELERRNRDLEQEHQRTGDILEGVVPDYDGPPQAISHMAKVLVVCLELLHKQREAIRRICAEASAQALPGGDVVTRIRCVLGEHPSGLPRSGDSDG